MKKYSPDLIILVFSNNDVRDNYESLSNLSPKIQLMINKPYFEFINNSIIQPRNFSVYHKSLIKSLLRKSSLLSFINNLIFKTTIKENYVGYGIFLENYTPAWKSAWNITFAILDKLNGEVAIHNASLIIVNGVDAIQLSPDKQDDIIKRYPLASTFNFQKPNLQLNNFCYAKNLSCINLYNHFSQSNETFFVEDGHWNDKGHELVAQVLVNYLQYHPLNK